MKVSILVVVLCVVPQKADAQHDGSAAKYWIHFVDKDGSPPEQQSELISTRARSRRATRGVSGGEWQDRPISARYLDAIRSMGIEPVVQSRWLNAITARLTDELQSRVSELDFVTAVTPVARYVRPNLSMESSSDPSMWTMHGAHVSPVLNAPNFDSSSLDAGPSGSQLDIINARTPLENGINGAGVRIGFLDTQFGGFEHAVFSHLVSSGRLIEVRDFVQLPQSSTHGLSVASVAVGYAPGQLIGPAYGAEVLAATTEYAPTETNQEEDFLVAGLEWLESMGVDVVNISLGYTTFDEGQHSYTPADLDGDTGLTTRAADRAAALGVTVVTSAGNEGCESPDICWYYIGTPADGDSVIAVGAVRPDSTRASFSSFGPTADGRIKPDVSAPGSMVYVATPGEYRSSAGTSFASPLVAGVVAQMLQVNPGLAPMDVREILRETASLADSPNNSLGWGIINANAAINRAAILASGNMGPDLGLQVEVYPNPATDRLHIHITRSSVGIARLTLFDTLGRRVQSAEQTITPGRNTISLPVEQLAAGLYLYSVELGSERTTGKVIVR